MKEVCICYGSGALEKADQRPTYVVEEDRSKTLSNVKLLYIDSPADVDQVALELAWKTVLLPVELLQGEGMQWFEQFRERFEECHRAVGLLLSDGAEWGIPQAKNTRKNLKQTFRRALDLRFPGVPAVIVGAGPSLEKNSALLQEISQRALILAGGHALQRLEVEPHFAGIIDGQGMIRSRFRRVPLCFQARAHAEVIKGFEGERLLAPDSHFGFLNWIAGIEGLLDGGWTVGNFLTRLAVEWGCSPIVFVGMDGCEAKQREGMVEALDGRGNRVWTQPDWLQAKRWTEVLACKHPEITWINATEGGLGFAGVEERPLAEIAWQERGDLRGQVRQAVGALALMQGRWKEWDVSLRGKEEVVEKLLLEPLWQLWRPVFERELESDPYEGKIELNRQLFFQQVIKEHLR